MARSTSAGRRGAPLAALLVGLAAAVISLGRLWLANHDALTQVIWAEDGVFPLCVRKAGFLTCLADPFAGYLLAVPRLVAGIVALLPMSTWALATNLIAAVIAGVVCGLAFAWARRFGLGVIAALVIGLLPVIAPVVGLEVINALGSTYMLLLYLSAVVLALPTARGEARWSVGPEIAIALLLLLTALTIPTAGIFLALIVVQVLRRVITVRGALLWVAAILLGLLAQWWTATNAVKPRVIAVSAESFTGWLTSLPDTLLTYWPGLQLGDFDFFGVFPITFFQGTGGLIALGLAVLGLVSLVRGGDRRVGIGLLVLSGIVIGAVPTIIGGSNNRYFVVPLLLWGAALVVALDPVIRRTRAWVIGLVAVLILIIWSPLISASWFRATPAPPWLDEVARVDASCKADPGKKERIIFSPYWPPNWGDALSEPTHSDVSCLVIWKD